MAKHNLQKKLRKQINERDLEIQLFVTRLEKVFSQEINKLQLRIAAGEELAVREAVVAIETVLDSVRSGAVSEEIRALEQLYAKELVNAREMLQEVGVSRVSYTKIDLDIVEQLVYDTSEDVKGKLARYTNEIRTEVMRGFLAGRDPQIDRFRDENDPRLFSQMQTEIRTQTMATNQSLQAAKARELGLELFMYFGPDDKVTRSFCEGVLNDKQPPIYTKDEIQSMDNGQGLSVLTHRGGYNCRHHWMPISEQFARDEFGYRG